MESLVELFYSVDDFCQVFLQTTERKTIGDGKQMRNRKQSLTIRTCKKITPHVENIKYSTGAV